MINKTILSLLLFVISTPIFLFLLKTNKDYLPKIQITFTNYENQDKFQMIQDNFYIYKNQKKELEKNFNYSFSYKPIGYLRFKKNGKEVEFFLQETNQLFWKKEAYHYPYFEPYGNFIFGINADRSQVEVMDVSGNLLYVLNGNFLVEVQCFEREKDPICLLLFSEGKVTFLSKTFKKDFFLNIERAFFKSFSLNKEWITFHYYKELQDYFLTYKIDFKNDISLKKQEEIFTSLVFPYTISFCKLEKTVLFPNFNEIIKLKENAKTIQLNPYQEELKTVETLNELSYLGSSQYLQDLCIIHNQKNLSFWSKNGNFLLNYVLNSKKSDFFYDHESLYVFLDSGYLTISF
ncbi:MAG: hypothetical protein ACK4UJ_10765 [Leptonema sp. (in: bacteria)]